MTKVYVLTNESDGNSLIGVYSTVTNAVNAMLEVMTGMSVHSVVPEEIGTRYIFNADDILVKMYIEEGCLDDPLFLPVKRKEY
jgi:hypothetical protein